MGGKQLRVCTLKKKKVIDGKKYSYLYSFYH